MTDIFTDVFCTVLYITSGDPFLMQLGWISTGLLSFSVFIGTLVTALDGALCT